MANDSHTHTAKCYHTALICSKVVHTHGGSIPGPCYDKHGNLKCSITEHTHSSGSPCYGATGPFCGHP